MTVFWSLAAVMVVVALLFVLPPLLRSRKTLAVSLDDLNTEVIRTQLDELEADLAAGKLDRAQYAAARTDLERELLHDLDSATPARHKRRSGRWAALLIVPALPVIAVLLYQQLGSVDLIGRLQQVQAPPPQSVQQQVASIEKMVDRLAERLQQQPDDVEGWVMLARSYTIMRRYGEATKAYENVLRLEGETPGLLIDYADAMVMANNGTFTDESGALLLRALERDPGDVKGLWLAGHWKYQSGAYKEALGYWQQAAAKLPPGSEDATVIAQQIGNVQTQLGITAAAAPATATTAPATDYPGGASLTVHVALAPAMAAAASPEDTVFIFARAVQGPRMPLAIVRKQVRDLPVTVILDDSMAMTPQLTLSKFDRVTVGARVSKSGNAMPQSGDLQGLVTPVNTQDGAGIELTIDNRVP